MESVVKTTNYQVTLDNQPIEGLLFKEEASAWEYLDKHAISGNYGVEPVESEIVVEKKFQICYDGKPIEGLLFENEEQAIYYLDHHATEGNYEIIPVEMEKENLEDEYEMEM